MVIEKLLGCYLRLKLCPIRSGAVFFRSIEPFANDCLAPAALDQSVVQELRRSTADEILLREVSPVAFAVLVLMNHRRYVVHNSDPAQDGGGLNLARRNDHNRMKHTGGAGGAGLRLFANSVRCD